MRRYEAMFLFDSATTREWSVIEQEVQRLIGRIDAKLLVCVKFDERKLAYEIDRRKRGTYVLTYIEADPERITSLERDVQLSEVVLRVLVLRADNLTEERLAELQAHPAETPLAPLASEGRHERRGGRDRRDDEGGGGRRRDYRGGHGDHDEDSDDSSSDDERDDHDARRERERRPTPSSAGE